MDPQEHVTTHAAVLYKQRQGALMLLFLDTVVVKRRKMAQRFRKHLHAGRVSMKYSRRSKRGGRRIEEIKCSDTSMVKNKEDFMKVLGLRMKMQDKEDKTEEADTTMEKNNDNSPATIRIRDCSVVITGENCKICGLLLKCTSDVIFHTEMRHGNGFIVCGNYIEANIIECQEKINADVQKLKRRRSSSNNNNDNKLRLTFKIGHEVISEISINRRHLKTFGVTEKRENDRGRGSYEESTTLKNDYKTSIVGIDSFFSSKNHCDDYVISVQPLNRTHQRASRDTLSFERSQHNSNSNYLEVNRGIEEINLTSVKSLQERLPRWSLQGDDITCNNNNNYNNNNNNNNNSLNIKDSLISECNMSDKENESRKTQPVKNFMDVNVSVQTVKTNLPPCQTNSDNEEIQEILHTIERKRINKRANIKRKLDYPLHEDTTISHSGEEFVESAKKIRWPTYSIVM